jgi:hypothetical protein
MYFWILLYNTFHFKGIQNNVANSAIDFKKIPWINNAYIYVWQSSYSAFD